MMASAVPALVVMAGFAVAGQHLGPNQVLVYGLALVLPVTLVGLWAVRELGRLVHEHDEPVDFTWISAVFPTFIVGVNVALQVRRGTSHDPTTLGWGLLLGLGTIAVLGWLGTLLWAVLEHRVLAAERTAPSTSVATPDTPTAVAPVT
jgi:hypothetical protein